MKIETINDWMKECRYLYKLLKEEHENNVIQQILLQIDNPLAKGEMKKIVEASWNVFCIEKNINPEDYDKT